MLVVAGGVVVAELEHRAWVETVAEHDAEVSHLTEEAESSRGRAEDAYARSHETLAAAIDDGRPVYADSKGQVDDPAVRRSLGDALAEAEELRDAEVAYPTDVRTVEEATRPNPFHPETLPEVTVEVVTGSDPAPAELDAAASAVTEVSEAVAEARRQWSYDALDAADTEGRDALTDLRAQGVGAGALRPLRGAVDDADAVLDAGVDEIDPDEAVALRDSVLDTTESLWTARLDEIFAERRRAARADGVDCRKDRCVALTFDDGPVADTRRLLRILDRKKAPATFFMLGENVAARPGVARAAADGGHLVASHSWDHPQLTTLDDAAVRDQLRRTQDAIADATGTAPFLLRPPYGDVDDRVRSLATRTGLDTVLWNLDTEDWRTLDAKETRRRVRAEVRPGSIILMHDIHPTSVDAVPKIIEDLRDEGYVLVTADLLVDRP